MCAAVGGYNFLETFDKVRISRERQKAPAFHTFATRSRGRIANRWNRLVFLRCGRGVEPFHASSTCPSTPCGSSTHLPHAIPHRVEGRFTGCTAARSGRVGAETPPRNPAAPRSSNRAENGFANTLAMTPARQDGVTAAERKRRLGGPGETHAVVLEDQALDEGLGDLLLFGGKAGDGLEMQAQILVGSALVLVEDQEVGRCCQRNFALSAGR
jgi:hypothetical protein